MVVSAGRVASLQAIVATAGVPAELSAAVIHHTLQLHASRQQPGVPLYYTHERIAVMIEHRLRADGHGSKPRVDRFSFSEDGTTTTSTANATVCSGHSEGAPKATVANFFLCAVHGLSKQAATGLGSRWTQVVAAMGAEAEGVAEAEAEGDLGTGPAPADGAEGVGTDRALQAGTGGTFTEPAPAVGGTYAAMAAESPPAGGGMGIPAGVTPLTTPPLGAASAVPLSSITSTTASTAASSLGAGTSAAPPPSQPAPSKPAGAQPQPLPSKREAAAHPVQGDNPAKVPRPAQPTDGERRLALLETLFQQSSEKLKRTEERYQNALQESRKTQEVRCLRTLQPSSGPRCPS